MNILVHDTCKSSHLHNWRCARTDRFLVLNVLKVPFIADNPTLQLKDSVPSQKHSYHLVVDSH